MVSPTEKLSEKPDLPSSPSSSPTAYDEPRHDSEAAVEGDDALSHSASSSSSSSSSADEPPGLTRSRPSHISSISGVDDNVWRDEHDGHRPHTSEILRASSRRLEQLATAEAGTSTTGLRRNRTSGAAWPRIAAASSSSSRRAESFLSTVRSRPAGTRPFKHPLAHVPTSEDCLVQFEGPDDPYRPVNWPIRKKFVTTLMYGLVTMSATWASSAYAAGTAQVAAHFAVGEQVAVLGTSLYLVGFGVGPLLWAPLSEVFGRRVAVLCPMFVALCFSFGSATAKDLQTLMLTRFFGAVFASAPVTNTGGVLGDLYTPATRGFALAGYAMAVVGGPTLAPIASAALVSAYPDPAVGWRWTEYVTGMLQAAILAAAALTVDESYPPRLLVAKARRLRLESGNWALHAAFEEWDVSPGPLARKFLVQPLRLLATPVCFLVALYASFCYGILYMQLGAIPAVFRDARGWPPVAAALPFLAIALGAATGAAVNCGNQVVYNRYYRAAGGRAVPERRLPPMMLGSVLFATGQFLTGWTARPAQSASWFPPVLGLYLTGCGFNTIFQAALNYLVDAFPVYAASAVAANTFLRSCFAAGFPLAVGPLYANLGIGPGSSIFAGFASLLVGVPFVFYWFGARLRAGNRWSNASSYED